MTYRITGSADPRHSQTFLTEDISVPKAWMGEWQPGESHSGKKTVVRKTCK